MAEEKTKKRCQNLSKLEKAFALELIKSQEEIFERFQGANQGKLKKKLCWEKIALSGVCPENRGVEEIKTMFKNSKNSEKKALANSVDPDETPHDAAIFITKPYIE
ncbi:hypothetical protein DPMN_131668 [Dreissena polymorpha]|uniref:Uncharacterized protein n=1 Tax=Dreissena polymorpha TaxID=45954 RepID=A0A9D4JD12_DREPO|nr:hypothetical protein DPMN_131668 [Dreissena polymorpha]